MLRSTVRMVADAAARQGRTVAAMGIVLALVVTIQAPAAATGPDVPVMHRTTVISAHQAASAIVDIPVTLEVGRDIPQQSLGGTEVVAAPSENFVGLILTSVDQDVAPGTSDLPRLTAVQLPMADGPRTIFALRGWEGELLANRLPAGRYRLSLLATGPVTATVTLPGLPEGSAAITASQPASYHLDYGLQDPTPAGVHSSTFTAGFRHTPAEDHQVFKYLWAEGDVKTVDDTIFCHEYGSTVSAPGVYAPHCGFGGAGRGFTELGVRQPYAKVWGWSDPASESRAYSVGGYWSVGGNVRGGGVLYLWLE